MTVRQSSKHLCTDRCATIVEAAGHPIRNFWRTRGQVVQKLCMFHIAVYPVLNLCADTRYWSRRELAEAKCCAFADVCRRALNLWLKLGEDVQDSSHCARECARDVVDPKRSDEKPSREHLHGKTTSDLRASLRASARCMCSGLKLAGLTLHRTTINGIPMKSLVQSIMPSARHTHRAPHSR